jgi:choline-sulfatase
MSGETVIVFTSDHGDMDSAHRLEHKSVFYEESIHIPFIISDPNGPSDETNDNLISNGLDLLPTVCDYAGVSVPESCNGRSIRSQVYENADDWRDHIRIESELGEAIVTDRYTYALFDSGANRQQLYDHEVDPGETMNQVEYNAQKVSELHQRLLSNSRII